MDKVIKKYLNDMFDSEYLNYVSTYDFDDEKSNDWIEDSD